MNQRGAVDLDHPLTALVVGTVTGLAMLCWTWGTWPDPIIDFGRELYLPWRISEGQGLYRDLASFNGPLSPYLNAAWFTAFGVGLRSLIIGNAIVLATLTALIYRLTSRLTDGRTAAAAIAFFLLVFAFGEYDQVGNYNYLTPYSHELVHGLVLSFAALDAAFSFVLSRASKHAWLCGLCYGLVLLTKPEVFVALTAALVIGGVAVFDTTRQAARAPLGRQAMSFAIAVALPPAGALAALSWRGTLSMAVGGIVDPYLFLSNGALRAQTFYRDMSGLSHSAESIAAMLPALLVWLAAVVALLWLSQPDLLRRWRFEVAAAAVVAGFVVAVIFNRSVVDQIARPLPLIAATTAFLLARRVVRRDARSRPLALMRLMFVTFAAMLTLKMVLNAHLRGYGFALLMPVMLVAIMAVLHWLPTELERRARDGGIVRSVGAGWLLAITMVFLLAHAERVRVMALPIGSGADRFYSDERAVPVSAALEFLAANTLASDRLVVLPEGIMLNYLSRRESSIRYTNFLPPEELMYGDGLLRALQDHPPEFVIVVQRPLREYGYRSFGVDYATAMASWVTSNYDTVVDIPGPRTMSGAFGMRIMQRSLPAKNEHLTTSRSAVPADTRGR